MATAYVDAKYVREEAVMSPEDLDWFEVNRPGFIDRLAYRVSRRVDAKLSKRHRTPVLEDTSDAGHPYPARLRELVLHIMQHELYMARGYDPSSAQDSELKELRDRALDDLDKMMSQQSGMEELPLRDSGLVDESAATKAGPYMSYEETAYGILDR